jgi:hypothetical protein
MFPAGFDPGREPRRRVCPAVRKHGPVRYFELRTVAAFTVEGLD